VTRVLVGELPVKSKEKIPHNDGGQTLERPLRTVVGSPSLESWGLRGHDLKHLGVALALA